MEPMSPPARYVTLRDYLRVLRRYWVPIGVITAIGFVAGWITANSQSASYRATSIVYIQDPVQSLALVGLQTNGIQGPGALAAQNAETLTRAPVIDKVRRELGGRTSTSDLSAALQGSVTTGGQLQIQATWSDPEFAARLANATAAAVVDQANAQAHATFAQAALQVQQEIASLSARPNSPAASVRLAGFEDELARVQTLSRIAQTARVADTAGVPTISTGSNTLRGALIGLAIGLLLGIVFAFVRDVLDRRLRTGQDVESSFDFPILGHVRQQALGQIAYTARSVSDGQQADLEAFRIVRRNIEFLNFDSPPRTIIVTSAVAEEGKTTVAGSLAFAYAAAGKRTLLVDCDLRNPSLAGRLGIEAKPGITDFLLGEASPPQVLRSIKALPPTSPNGANAGSAQTLLVAIPAGSPSPHAPELLASQQFKDFLDQILETYDVVVMDSSPLLPVSDTLEMLPHAEAVVVCARESRTTRDEALAVKTALARFSEIPVGVVITGVKPGRGDYAVYTRAYTH